MSAVALPLRRDPLELAAGVAFVLLLATTATSIAPEGIAAGLCGALTLALLVRRREGWPRTPVDRAGMFWFAALIVVALCSLDPAASLPRVTKGLFPLLVGVTAFHARERRTAERALAVYLAAFALVSAYGLAVWVVQGASFASRARGIVGHYMTFAGQLSLALPVAIAIALCEQRPRWRWGAALTALVALAALAVTFTRSAWIALFVACAVIAGALWPLGILVLALLGGAAFAFAPGAWHDRLWSIFDPHHPQNQQRVYMWDAGLRMFRDHPLTGVGLQDLHTLYDRYRSPLSTERAGHLHSIYVQIAAQMGLVGLAAFTWLYTSFVRTATIGLRATLRRRGLAAGVRLGVLATLIGFLAAGAFEWNFGSEVLLYQLYALVGLAWAAHVWEGQDNVSGPEAPVRDDGAPEARRSQGWREPRLDAVRARQDAEPNGPSARTGAAGPRGTH